MGSCSMSEHTEPRLWSNVYNGDCGQRRQKTSRHFSPPRIPVIQSWTRTTRAFLLASMHSPPAASGLATDEFIKIGELGKEELDGAIFVVLTIDKRCRRWLVLQALTVRISSAACQPHSALG